MTNATAFPLTWPLGRPRTPPQRRKSATFGRADHSGSWTSKKSLSIADARLRLQHELERLGASDIILSTNVELRLDGLPRSNRRLPDDPGAALYFRLNGRDTAMACDKWDRVADNIAAIAKHIDALRGIERWGVGSLEQAFAGFQQLPAPEQWWQVLGVKPDATLEQIDAAWRAKMAEAHPDRGGCEEVAKRLNWARAEGRKQ
ncbi:J domain-containing protein [Pelagerythrobacter marensis]|uniref:J domain-containing protein n=1 Tax=Pelagerythrobacter marensis TaxID=543877 RepID=A0ABZ2D1W8_9SPHN